MLDDLQLIAVERPTVLPIVSDLVRQLARPIHMARAELEPVVTIPIKRAIKR